MHFVLVGPGALGCLLSSLLAESGSGEHRFTLLDHNAARAESLTSRGILYQQNDEQRTVPIRGSSAPHDIEDADVIILCVKSYDIDSCLQFCTPLINDGSLLLFLQNGVAHLDSAKTDGHICAFGTTTEGATLLAPGNVRHAGKGLTQLGFLGPVPKRAQAALDKTAALFNRAGLTTAVREDILSRLWTKLLINTGINGLTAIQNCTNGELLEKKETTARMELLIREGQAVATKSGISVPANALEMTFDVCRKTRENYSSMLQDVRSGRRTEIDSINGALASHGKTLGIETPENHKLVQDIKRLEMSYPKR